MARVHREVEVKLACPAGFVVPDLSALGAPHAGDVLGLTAVYFDTADLRLARSGVTLRRRTGGTDDGWTLKLPDAGDRTEVTLPIGAATPPAELRRLTTAFARGAPLRKAVTVTTQRSPVRVLGPDGAPLAEVVVDHVTAETAHGLASSWCEVEVEALGEGVDLSPYVALLRAAGARRGSQVAKAVRALGPTAALPGDPPPASSTTKGDPARSLVEHALRTHTRSLVLQDARVRLDLEDSVHQMRVAARRLRSALRSLRPLLDEEWVQRTREELAWLGHAMGAARDAEVGLALVDEVLDEIGAGEPLRELVAREYAVADAHAGAVRALESRRWPRLLEALVAAAYEPPVTAVAGEPVRAVAPELLEQAWDHLAKRADKLRRRRSPAADYHRVRVLAKRVRYTAETLAPAYGKPAARFASRVSDVQDVLGDHHDLVVASEVLHRLAGSAGVTREEAFGLGRAVQVMAVRERALRKEFHQLWTEVRRGRHRHWIT